MKQASSPGFAVSNEANFTTKVRKRFHWLILFVVNFAFLLLNLSHLGFPILVLVCLSILDWKDFIEFLWSARMLRDTINSRCSFLLEKMEYLLAPGHRTAIQVLVTAPAPLSILSRFLESLLTHWYQKWTNCAGNGFIIVKRRCIIISQLLLTIPYFYPSFLLTAVSRGISLLDDYPPRP